MKRKLFSVLFLSGAIVGCGGGIPREETHRDAQGTVVSMRVEQQPMTKCGRGLRIGMIDVPVDVQAFGERIVYRNFATGKLPETGHGTHIAGLLIGNTLGSRGLLSEAQLYAANIFYEDEHGRIMGSPVAFAEATEWLISQDVDVVNISINGYNDPMMQDAVERFAEEGIVVVAAAGNNRGLLDRDYPAAYPSVLAATAIDESSRIYQYASTGAHVDFAAPGVRVQFAGDSNSHSGTSFAAPYLTAAVALEIQQGTPRNADSLRRKLSSKAFDLGQKGKDTVFGYGSLPDPTC